MELTENDKYSIERDVNSCPSCEESELIDELCYFIHEDLIDEALAYSFDNTKKCKGCREDEKYDFNRM